MTVDSIDQQLAELEPQLNSLIERKRILESHKRNLQSQEFIRANRITLADVELSRGEDKPWFGTVYKFGEWLKTHSHKRFCEWNHGIYFTSDIVAERMPDQSMARLEDFKNV